MAPSTLYYFTSALPSLFSFSTDKPSQPSRSPCFNSFKPIFTSKINPSSIGVYRSKFSSSAAKLACRVFTVNGSVDGDSVTDPGPESDSEAVWCHY